jgi:hypothetical protein
MSSKRVRDEDESRFLSLSSPLRFFVSRPSILKMPKLFQQMIHVFDFVQDLSIHGPRNASASPLVFSNNVLSSLPALNVCQFSGRGMTR